MLKSPILVVLCACASAEAPRVDAPPPPIDPAGVYALHSQLVLAQPVPGPTTAVLAELAAADDPSRYLVDHMIAALPDGQMKTAAQDVAPFLAAYLDSKLGQIAPKFLPGMRQLAAGVGRLGQELDTMEALRIDGDGSVVRAITGITVAGHAIELAGGGIPDAAGASRARFAGAQLTIEAHTIEVPYSRIVRLALDQGLIPAVDPGAHDLAGFLHDVVDCPNLGVLIAQAIGLGPPALYEEACTVAMSAAASHLYGQLAQLDDMPLALTLRGGAQGLDLNRDGHLDAIVDGVWTGMLGPPGSEEALSAATFEGQRQ